MLPSVWWESISDPRAATASHKKTSTLVLKYKMSLVISILSCLNAERQTGIKAQRLKINIYYVPFILNFVISYY